MTLRKTVFGRGKGLAKKVIAIYKLSDATDSLAVYNGTAGTGVTFSNSNAVDGDAGQFNGSILSRITIPDNDAFSFTTGTVDKPFSIKFNINRSATTPALSPIVGRYSGSNNNTSEFLVYLRSGKLAVLFFNKNTGGVYIGAEAPLIPAITNTNVIVNYSGSGVWTGIQILYNGVSQTLAALNSGSGYVGMGNTSQVTIIGSHALNLSTQNYQGTIDELYFFNDVLTSDEIATLQTLYYPNF